MSFLTNSVLMKPWVRSLQLGLAISVCYPLISQVLKGNNPLEGVVVYIAGESGRLLLKGDAHCLTFLGVQWKLPFVTPHGRPGKILLKQLAIELGGLFALGSTVVCKELHRWWCVGVPTYSGSHQLTRTSREDCLRPIFAMYEQFVQPEIQLEGHTTSNKMVSWPPSLRFLDAIFCHRAGSCTLLP